MLCCLGLAATPLVHLDMAAPQTYTIDCVYLHLQVLAAFDGGRVTMYGKQVAKRWTKLATTAVSDPTCFRL